MRSLGGDSTHHEVVNGLMQHPDRARVTYGVRVIADGRDLGEHALATLVVGNGRYAGGGMLFCPDARLDDGALDLVVISHAGLVRAAMRTPNLYRGTLAALPGVITARVSEVTVEALAHTAYFDLDGESPGRATATFRMHPGALRLAGAPVER